MSLTNFIIGEERGFTLLEVVFAASILAMGIMGYTHLKVSSSASRNYAGNVTKSTLLTNGQMEEMLLNSYKSIDLTAGTHADVLRLGDFTINVTYNVQDSCPSQYTKLITYTGSWNEGNRSRSITLSQVRVDR